LGIPLVQGSAIPPLTVVAQALGEGVEHIALLLLAAALDERAGPWPIRKNGKFRIIRAVELAVFSSDARKPIQRYRRQEGV
jgi:hypothetical protein